MISEGTDRVPLETGGILLGWRSGDDRVIVDVLGPGLRALHGRYRFLPDHGWQVSEIHRIFRESRGDIDYLGDWHTHPGGQALMSGEDHLTLRRIEKRVRNPVMMILAGEKTGWTLGCWDARREGRLLFRNVSVHEQPVRLVEAKPDWPRVSAADSEVHA